MSARDSVMNSQSALVSAIYGHSSDQIFDTNGLTVYQNSLAANADRALAISFPTIQQLVGEQGFSHLSNAFLHDFPLIRGDWGEWGREFPAWLEANEQLQDYPYFSDCAQLDWCCHVSERATDETLDVESLGLLADGHAYQLKLRCSSSVKLVTSAYPIVDIWNAHHLYEGEAQTAEHALALAAQNLAQQAAQNALVWRPQWKAQVRAISTAEILWYHLLQQGESIGAALDELHDSDFSFESWLPDALSQGIVCGIDNIDNSSL
ncbi:MAG: DNA-binding domain-containing protein [Pseudomonadales bacterium]